MKKVKNDVKNIKDNTQNKAVLFEKRDDFFSEQDTTKNNLDKNLQVMRGPNVVRKVSYRQKTSEENMPSVIRHSGKRIVHSDNIVSVTNYCQRFKNFHMKDVNFKVKRNSIHALIGESGSGKSVIIESIIGALPKFKGEIFINDYKSSRAKSKMQIGYSTNLENFPNELSAYSFLKLLGQLTSLKSKYMIEKLDSLLVDFGLWEHREKKLRNYSSGMKNRVMIIHAMMNDPELLIFDEPGANLDFRNRQFFYHTLSQLRDRGKSILLTTHMIDELDDLIDDCTIISYGRMLYSGTYDIFKKQKNYFVKTDNNEALIKFMVDQRIIVHYNSKKDEVLFTLNHPVTIENIYSFLMNNRINISYCQEIKNDLTQLKLKLFSFKQKEQINSV